MPAPKFADIVGRVGRAFADTDGPVVLPVFHGRGGPHRAGNRIRGFKSLVRSTTERELESGLVLFVRRSVDLWSAQDTQATPPGRPSTSSTKDTDSPGGLQRTTVARGAKRTRIK